MHDLTHNTPSAKASSAPGSIQALKPQRILAIDLGKFSSVACDDQGIETGTDPVFDAAGRGKP